MQLYSVYWYFCCSVQQQKINLTLLFGLMNSFFFFSPLCSFCYHINVLIILFLELSSCLACIWNRQNQWVYYLSFLFLFPLFFVRKSFLFFFTNCTLSEGCRMYLLNVITEVNSLIMTLALRMTVFEIIQCVSKNIQIIIHS